MIIKKDKELLVSYSGDASNFSGNPDVLFIPENINELRKCVKNCYLKKIPFTISGAGTGLTGGRVALSGACISSEKLNRIIEINFEQQYIIVEPGVLLKDVEEELSKIGFFLPPNPTEKNCTIGGNAATNASGSRTFKYGSFRDYILQLKIILPNGEETHLRRSCDVVNSDKLLITTLNNITFEINFEALNIPNVKHSAGYYLKQGIEPIDLFIGSEGTLGVISEIKLKILPKPENVLGIICFFDNINGMLDFIQYIRDKSIVNNMLDYRYINDLSARLIEYFDGNSLDLLRVKFPQIPEYSVGAIWIEQEYAKKEEDKLLPEWNEIICKYTNFKDNIWVALDEESHRKFQEFRHALPLKINEILSHFGQKKIGTDTAVPIKHFIEFFNFINKEFGESLIENATWGHIGNCHIHANLLPHNIVEYENGLKIFERIIRKAIDLNGTVSAEHGIGKLKKNYLQLMFGDYGISEMRKIKKIIDPDNLLGRGNLFD